MPVDPSTSEQQTHASSPDQGHGPATGGEPSPGALGSMPGLLGVDHVGLAVADLDEAVAFHTGVLGLQVTHRETNADQQVHEAMLAAPGAAPGAAQVQLLAPAGPGSTIARFLERSGPGLQQLAYRVADVDAAAEHLRARGVRVLFDQARRGTAGSRVNFAHPKDCGGVLVELVEPAVPPPGPAEHG